MIAQSPQIPFDLDLVEVPVATNGVLCQRWRERRSSWARPGDGGFDASRYFVGAIGEKTAKAYVTKHHYSGTYPAAARRYGLFVDDDSGDPLVGVAVLGIPSHRQVLLGVFPDLEPYVESLELSRFVLEGDVGGAPHSRAPANAETWFLARVYDEIAAGGVRGVVAFSDPVPRRGSGGVVLPGHTGAIYQAGNAVYTGRGARSILTVLPDGTVLNKRSLQKVRGDESGHEGVERRLVALGARSRRAGESSRAWLDEALARVGVVRLRHRGCHRYAFAIGATRSQRRRVRIAMPGLSYPKQPDGLA